MEDTLDHLPPKKRDELARAADIIRQRCPGVGLVLVFGSYARGDWKEEADMPAKCDGASLSTRVMVSTESD